MAMRLVICRLAMLSGWEANAQGIAGCSHAWSKGSSRDIMRPRKGWQVRLGNLKVDEFRYE